MRRRQAARTGWILGVALLLLWLIPGSARGDKRYDADRFDVQVRLDADGTTQVTETVVFRFEGGTFTQVSRVLPLRQTDGIEVLAAGLDEAAVGVGRDAGDRRLEVSRKDNRLRAVWRFPPLQGAHTFSLTYRVRGLVQRGDDEDVLAWAALPRDYDYRIARSRVTLQWPREARLRLLTANGEPLQPGAEGAAVELGGLGRDRSVTLRATFDPGTAAPTAAGWQQRAAFRRQVAPTWAGLAAALFAVATVLFWLFWARSPRPAGREAFGPETVPYPPGEVPPAIAGALVAKGGGLSTLHLMGGVLDLARRGVLRIEEQPKGRWGSRTFVVRREGGKSAQGSQALMGAEGPGRAGGAEGPHGPLRPHERVMLESLFVKKGRAEHEVALSAVLTRLTRGSGPITRAVRQELTAAGLIDHDRLRSRRRMITATLVVLFAGLASLLLPIPLADEHGGWPFLLPLALIASSLVGLALAASLPAQTDEGLRQGERWKRYGSYLHRVARKSETTAPISADALPYAAAFGAAAAYAAAMQRRGSPMPAWFQAASVAADQQRAAFVALMTATVTSGGAGGAGGGGGAAGGGSSSAS